MTIAFTARSYSRVVVRKLVLVVALAALLAGCGGSGHVRHGQRPTKAGFAIAADQVCHTAKTHRTRLAGLRPLVPKVPLAELDLYRRWLSAERLAVAAGDVLTGRKKGGRMDPLVELAIARGKIAGFARRLGAGVCAVTPRVTMPS
jgi:hypothetical protein